MRPYIQTRTSGVYRVVFPALLMLLAFASLQAQTTIFSENFLSSNGTVQGTGNPPKWTIDDAGTSPWDFEVKSNVFTCVDIDGEAEWYSMTIPLYGWTSVSASVDISEGGTLESDDYIRVYYKLNGGSETYFTSNGNNTDDFGSRTATVSGLSGNTLQIVIRVDNDATDEFHYIDNVTVTGTSSLYSEDFSTYSSGTTTSSKWTISSSGASPTVFSVQSGRFQQTDADAQVSWTSSVIDISTCTSVSASVNVQESGYMESTDYIRVYYKLNGGTETYFTTYGNNSDDFGSRTATVSGLTGSTLQIVIRTNNSETSEYHYWDDIVVTGSCNNISALSLSTVGTNISCVNPTGSVNLSVTNGQSPYSFSWSNGATTEDLSSLTAGTYTVTVTGNNGATATTTRVIANYLLTASGVVSSNYNGAQVSCPGSTNGAIDLSVSNGNLPYTYAWSTGATTQDISGLAAGSYTVTVTDNPSISVSFSQEVNAGSNDGDELSDGTMDIYDTKLEMASGRRMGMRFTNVTVPKNATISNAYIEFVAETGHSGSCSFTFYGHDTDDATAFTTSDDNISNRTSTSATVNWSSMSSWSGGVTYTSPNLATIVSEITSRAGWASGNDLAILATSTGTRYPASYDHGSYAGPKLYITYLVGCSDTVTVVVSNPTALNPSTSVTNATCPNSTNGAVNLSVTGGTGSKTYQWNSGQTTEDISSVIMENYTVTVTDANGCTASTTAAVGATGNITSSLAVTNVTTPGGSNGAIVQTVSGGTSPYTYSWSTGATTKDISGLVADYYEVTITDNTGCTYNTVGKVVERVSLFCEDFTSYTNGTTTSSNWTQSCGSCTVGSDGDWEVQSGKWQAADVDAQGVWTSKVIDITGYINLSATVDLAESGTMGTDDYIRVYYKLNGGAETLFKTNGDKTDDFTSATASQSNLMGTTLQIIIKVDNDVTTHIHTFDNVCVSGELALDIALAHENVICNGGNNGSIDLTVHNIATIPPFTYSWSNGATTQDLSGLTAGTYNVTVTGGAYYQTDFYVVASSDDADQTTGGTMALTGSGLNMSKTANKIVGLRFQNITIPKNAVITNAYVEFTAQSNGSGTCNVTISGYATDNTSAFTTSSYNMTSRSNTSTVSWSGLSSWSTDATYQTPDLQSIVQTIVNRSGWASGNSMGFEFEATSGARIPYSYDGSSTKAARLVVTYVNTDLVKTGSVVVTQPTALSANISPTNTSCPTSTNGAANLTASGGTAPRTFLWSNGITSEDLTGLKTGSYSVTVTDANGCTATANTTVNSTSNISSTLSVSHITTPGGSDGAIAQTVTGASGSPTFAWSDGSSTSEDRTGLAMGTYTVTITDAVGCTKTKSTIILDPESISCQDFSAYSNGTTSGPWTQTCSGCSQIDFEVQSGQWAAYDLDAQGVWTSNTINISGYSNVRASVSLSETDQLEYNDYIRVYYKLDGGSETLFASNGDKTDDFGSATAVQTGLSGTTLQIVVRVWNDAERHYFDNVCVVGYPPFYVDAEQTNLTCFGGSDGAIDLTVVNGTGVLPFTFDWSNGSSSEDLTDLTAGTYTVTVSDSTGSSRTKTITLTQPANSMSVNNTIVNVTCHGSSDATIILAVSGGNSPYSFLWSNGSTSMNPSGLSAGTYTVTVTDGSGCTFSDSYVVTSPTQPLDMTFTGTPSFCTSGSTQLVVSGAQNYTWTPPTGLSATDIPNPTINPTSTTTYYVTANTPGASNLVANGGFESGNIGFSTQYSYTTNNLYPEGRYGIGTNANTYHSNFFSSGDHTSGSGKFMIVNGAVTLNMELWCQNLNVQEGASYAFSTWISSVHPSNPAQLEFSINGTLLGTSITAPNVRYVWDQFTANWTSDTSAARFCIVNRNTIAGGNDFALDDIVITPTCTDVDTITITVNTLPSAVGDVDGGDDQDICYGDTAELEASGGATYAWSNGTSAAINNVSPTTDTDYMVTVSDSNGCTASDTVSVHVFPEIVVVVDSTSNIICGGANTGYVHISVSGGASPYTYAWSTGATSQDLDNVVAGIYTVTVTDANSCTVALTDTLENISDKTITLNKTDISCNNLSDGAIDISVTGGTPPYTYDWSTGATTQDITVLAAGTYTVTVTGQNGCPNDTSITIVNPAVLTPSAVVTDISCNGLTDGVIDVSVAGGWTPYTYSWNGGQTTQDRSGLAVASYTVTVTDNRSCTATLTRAIAQPAVLSSSTSVTNAACNGASSGAIDLAVSGGNTPYTYIWSDGTTAQDISNIAADEYWVTVTDARNCVIQDSAIVTQPALALDATLTIQSVSCTGLNDGEFEIAASGGTAPYTYLAFFGNAPGPVDSLNATSIEYVSTTTDSLSPQAVTVVVTDDVGCTFTVSDNIGSEGPIVTFSKTDISCNGGSTGAIDLTVNGEPPFTFNWSNGASTEDLTNIIAGTYVVTVTDSSGCYDIESVVITQPPFTASVNTTNATCPYSTNGSASVSITSGGIAPFGYAWSTGATTQSIVNLTTGLKSVTITDAAGCTISASNTVLSTSNIATSVFIIDVTVHGGSNGSITQTVSGGIAPYTYAWSNGAITKNITNITAGNYTVTITDASGCTLSESHVVDEPGACPCTWLGTTSNDWSVASNWDCGFAPTDTCDVVITAGANTCTINSGTASCRHLNVQAGITLVIAGSSTLDIYGNIVNNGNITLNTSTVRFVGSAEQTVSGSTLSRFHNLHINNSSATGVVLTNNIEVNNELRLMDGYLFTDEDTVKMMSDVAGKLTVYSSNSFVVGKLFRKISNTGSVGYDFPVGDAGTSTRYFKASIKAVDLQGTTSLTVWFGALERHTDDLMATATYNPPVNMNSYYNYAVPYVKISNGDTVVSTNFGGSAGTVTGIINGVNSTTVATSSNYVTNIFSLEKTVETDGIMYSHLSSEGVWYFEPDQQPTGGFYHMILSTENLTGLTDNNFGVLKRPEGSDSRYWSGGGGSMKPFGGPGRLVSDGFALRMYLTTFSEGGAGGGGGGGLPIELLDFKAELIGDDVDITWVTATEINNDYFTIEKSDGSSFKEIAIIPGAGNSSSTRYYSKVDYEPFAGTSYYRLKQTDYDGKFSYSDVVSVTYEPADPGNEDDEMVVFPNPSDGNFTVVLKNAAEEVTISLFDNTGKLVMTETYSANEDNHTHKVSVQNIPSGVYFLKAHMDEKNRYTKKLMLFGDK